MLDVPEKQHSYNKKLQQTRRSRYCHVSHKVEVNNTNLATPVYKCPPCTCANKREGGEQGMVERGGDMYVQYIHI